MKAKTESGVAVVVVVWGRCALERLYLNTYKAEERILLAKDGVSKIFLAAKPTSGSLKD